MHDEYFMGSDDEMKIKKFSFCQSEFPRQFQVERKKTI